MYIFIAFSLCQWTSFLDKKLYIEHFKSKLRVKIQFFTLMVIFWAGKNHISVVLAC